MIDVTDGSFERDVLRAETPVVVDFWAPWCSPCKAVEKVFRELEAELGDDVTFARLNVDQNPATAARYDVLSLPSAIVFKDGEPRGTVVGLRSRRHYERWLSESVPSRP